MAEFRQAADEAARENPRDSGYEFTRWTGEPLARRLAGTTGVEVGAATIRNNLAELGFHWGRLKLDLAHRHGPAEAARAKRLRNGALRKKSSAAAAGRSCISTKPNST